MVFPTQVGVILGKLAVWAVNEGIPHASGGDPYGASSKRWYR